MTEFVVLGPFEVPVHVGNGRIVRDEEGREFFRHHPTLASKRGCYIFAMRSGGGITPTYVGKATKSFGQECFTSHKLGKCNQSLVRYSKGKLVLFLFERPNGKGNPSVVKMNQLEVFLILTALAANENLLNIKQTRQQEWSIRGVIRSSAGNPSKAAAAAKRMLRIGR